MSSDYSIAYAYEIIDKYTPALKKIVEQNKKFLDSQKQNKFTLKQLREDVDKTAKSFDKLGKSLSLKITAPLIAAGAFAMHEWNKQAEANAQVMAALESTGGKVGFTFEQLAKQATDLQKTRLFTDEDILAGVTASLLKFSKISGATFTRAQKLALDVATTLHTDLPSAAQFLGRALSNPVLSMRQLRLVGVYFSRQQEAQLKMLVRTGQVAKYQKMVLDALDTKVGGRAEKLAKAGFGPMILAKQQLFDSLERFGGILFSYLVKLTPIINKMADAINSLTPAQMKWIAVIGAMAAALGPILIALGLMASGLAVMMSPVFLVTAALAALAAGFAWLYVNWNRIAVSLGQNKFFMVILAHLMAFNQLIEDWFTGIFNFFNMIGSVIDRVVLGVRQVINALDSVSESKLGKIAGMVGQVVLNPMQAGVNLAGQIGINVNAAPGTVKSVNSSFSKGVKTGVSMKNSGT